MSISMQALNDAMSGIRLSLLKTSPSTEIALPVRHTQQRATAGNPTTKTERLVLEASCSAKDQAEPFHLKCLALTQAIIHFPAPEAIITRDT